MIRELINYLKVHWCIAFHARHHYKYPVHYNGEAQYHCPKCKAEFFR